MNIKNFIKILPLKITSMSFLFLGALTSCDDENNLLVTEKEIKQTNSTGRINILYSVA